MKYRHNPALNRKLKLMRGDMNHFSKKLLGRKIFSSMFPRAMIPILSPSLLTQSVITNIRTLPPVFPKMLWTAIWWKTRDGCFWHYKCKTIYLCSRKIALTVFAAMGSISFFVEIKMLLQSKKFSGNWQKKHYSRKFVHHIKA